LLPDSSGWPNGPNFKGQAVQEDGVDGDSFSETVQEQFLWEKVLSLSAVSLYVLFVYN